MKAFLEILSVIFALIAAYFLITGLRLETNVSVDGQTVPNLQLMHVQAVQIEIGLAAALAAVIAITGRSVIEAVYRAARYVRSGPATPPTASTEKN